ncbi:hypothetical protein FOZ63_001828 [Perkinsus olseni]|uniref:Uncharacterized protein n=1 Tax=Perkinsus olseni TaxID=32597 RepID=A0A7J6QUB8_PEROL|nr:hypothetical protein FOZ63_001828 [Perkinsus olseni]
MFPESEANWEEISPVDLVALGSSPGIWFPARPEGLRFSLQFEKDELMTSPDSSDNISILVNLDTAICRTENLLREEVVSRFPHLTEQIEMLTASRSSLTELLSGTVNENSSLPEVSTASELGRAVKDIACTEEFHHRLQPVAGAVDGVKALSRVNGAEVSIFFPNPGWPGLVQLRIGWIHEHFGSAWTAIVCGESPLQFSAHFFIDKMPKLAPVRELSEQHSLDVGRESLWFSDSEQPRLMVESFRRDVEDFRHRHRLNQRVPRPQ